MINILRSLKVNSEPISFQAAENGSDFLASARLVHDCYVKRGIMKPHPHGIRITPWSVLPTTTTLLATLGSKVLGTVSLVADGPMGLPSESFISLDEERSHGKRIVECSSFAVDPECANENFRVSLSLLSYVIRYVTSQQGIDLILLTVHPRHALIYQKIFLCRRIHGEKIFPHPLANNLPTVALVFDVKSAKDRLLEAYKKQGVENNIYRFIFESPCFKDIQRSNNLSADFLISPSILEEIDWATSLLENIDASQHKTIFSHFSTYNYPESLRKFLKLNHPTEARFSFNGESISDLGSRFGVRNVSRNGFQLAATMPVNTLLQLHFPLRKNEQFRAEAVCKWSDGKGRSGFELIDVDWNWLIFFTTLETKIRTQIQNEPNRFVPLTQM